MTKIYQTKLNQSVEENVHTIADSPTKRFKRYDGGRHFSEFLTARWRQKSTGIDTKQRYVTVSLCVLTTNRPSLQRLVVRC